MSGPAQQKGVAWMWRFALISQSDAPPRVGHFDGRPPELTGGEDRRRRLPWPQVVVMEETPSGVSLYRFTTTGESAGQTWHRSVDDARYQAQYEYGDLIGEWRDVPSDVKEPVRYALDQRG